MSGPTQQVLSARLREMQGTASSWVLEVSLRLLDLEGEEILSSLMTDRSETLPWDSTAFRVNEDGEN